MLYGTWRGLAGAVTALLLLAPAAQAQTTSPATAATAAKPHANAVASKAAKPQAKSVAKVAAKKPTPAHPNTKLAAAPRKPSKKLADTTKKPGASKVAAAKKSEPAKASIATAKSEPPSYTVTTTRDGVTTTATRIVPLPQASAPKAVAEASRPAEAKRVEAKLAEAKPAEAKPVEAKVAALPVSLMQPASSPQPAPADKAAAAAAPPPAAPPEPTVGAPAKSDAAASFVSNFLKAAFHLAKAEGKTSLQRRAELAELFGGKMDVKRIAGYTTANELAGASPEIQNRFRTILVSYLVETYYPRLELAADPSVRVETSQATALADGTAVVWTTFTKDGWGSQTVEWHLASGNGGYKIIDIHSAGASLVQMERDTFRSVMRDGGLSQLMAKLDARTKELASAATE